MLLIFRPIPPGNYLEISNFNYNGVAPVLYDLTNGARYVCDITDPTLVKVLLQPSAVDRKLVLVSEDAGNISTGDYGEAKKFY